MRDRLGRAIARLGLVAAVGAGLGGLPGPASAAPAAPAAPAQGGGLSIRLLDAPVDRADDPRARLYIVDHLHQGAVIERHVEVANSSTEPMHVRLYAGAASVDGGQFSFADGEGGNELATWTTVEPAALDLPAGATRSATVRVAVPETAVDGERYAVVWAELPASVGSGSVAVVNRVGVRIYLSVGTGAEPVSSFTVDSLRARRDGTGRPIVEATVTNTGGRALDLTGELTLGDGPGGTTAGPFAVELGTTLAVGASAPARVLLDPALPAGPWRARVTVRAGAVEETAEATITFPAAAGAAASPVPAEPVDRARSMAIVLDALLVVGVLTALAVVVRRRRPA